MVHNRQPKEQIQWNFFYKGNQHQEMTPQGKLFKIYRFSFIFSHWWEVGFRIGVPEVGGFEIGVSAIGVSRIGVSKIGVSAMEQLSNGTFFLPSNAHGLRNKINVDLTNNSSQYRKHTHIYIYIYIKEHLHI